MKDCGRILHDSPKDETLSTLSSALFHCLSLLR